MTNTEDRLRAALAASDDPADSGFTDALAARIDAVERRRKILLALMMGAGALLVAVMFAGLFAFAGLAELPSQQNWFHLPPATVNEIASWATVAGAICAAAIGTPLLRPRS